MTDIHRMVKFQTQNIKVLTSKNSSERKNKLYFFLIENGIKLLFSNAVCYEKWNTSKFREKI